MKTAFTPAPTTACPLQYKVQTSPDATTFTDFNDTTKVYDNSLGVVLVNLATPQQRTQYYMVAFDNFNHLVRIAVHIEVCGYETNTLVDANTLGLAV